MGDENGVSAVYDCVFFKSVAGEVANGILIEDLVIDIEKSIGPLEMTATTMSRARM